LPQRPESETKHRGVERSVALWHFGTSGLPAEILSRALSGTTKARLLGRRACVPYRPYAGLRLPRRCHTVQSTARQLVRCHVRYPQCQKHCGWRRQRSNGNQLNATVTTRFIHYSSERTSVTVSL